MLLLLQGPRCKLLIALQPFQWKSIDRSGHLLRVCWCYHCSHLSSHEEMLAVSLVWMKFPHPPGFVTDVSAVSTGFTECCCSSPTDAHLQLCFRGSRPPVDATPGTLLFAASVLFEFLSAPWPDLTWLL